MEPSGETPKLSTQEKLAQAKVESTTRAAEGLNKVESARSKTREFIKGKINQFRKWDHDMSVRLLGGIGALPEQGRILVQAGVEEVGKGIKAGKEAVVGAAVAGKEAVVAGVEAGKEAVVSAAESAKRFVVEKKNALIERGREVGRWFEARGNDIENFAETTKDNIVDSVDRGVDKVVHTHEAARSGIVSSYETTTGFMSDKAKELKLRVIRVNLEFQANIAQESAMGTRGSVEKNRIRLEKQQAIQEKKNNRAGSLEHRLNEINKELNKNK